MTVMTEPVGLARVLRTNGSVRAFRAEPVTDDELFTVLDHARFAPSGGNKQGWRVVVLRDATRRAAVLDLMEGVAREYVALMRDGQRPFGLTAHGRWPGPGSVDLAAARAFTYQVAWEVTQGTLDPKTLHAKAASIKLFASEMANRVVDSCVQVLGGRGYMRENAVERFYRDLRVDRIWEGTSEIQKVVLVNEMRKRGTSPVAAWPKQA